MAKVRAELLLRVTNIRNLPPTLCTKKERKMKIRFAYWNVSKYFKNSPANSIEIRHAFEVFDAPEKVRRPYSKYLLSTLDSDFAENRFGSCDKLLNEIKKIEDEEIENFVFEYDGFIHYVNKNSVTFEHAIFGVCPHWPLWSCPLSHYKIAVQAARDFYALPESLNSEVVVELPESDMAQVTLFPPILSENEIAREENPR